MLELQTGKTYADCPQNGVLMSNCVPSLGMIFFLGFIINTRCRPFFSGSWPGHELFSVLGFFPMVVGTLGVNLLRLSFRLRWRKVCVLGHGYRPIKPRY